MRRPGRQSHPWGNVLRGEPLCWSGAHFFISQSAALWIAYEPKGAFHAIPSKDPRGTFNGDICSMFNVWALHGFFQWYLDWMQWTALMRNSAFPQPLWMLIVEPPRSTPVSDHPRTECTGMHLNIGTACTETLLHLFFSNKVHDTNAKYLLISESTCRQFFSTKIFLCHVNFGFCARSFYAQFNLSPKITLQVPSQPA